MRQSSFGKSLTIHAVQMALALLAAAALTAGALVASAVEAGVR